MKMKSGVMNQMSPISPLKGKKPTDATVRLWVAFWVTGDKCESYSYDMFGRKAHKGGKILEEFSHNFSDELNHYELRFPHKNMAGNNNCTIIFRDGKVEVGNNVTSIFPGLEFRSKDVRAKVEVANNSSPSVASLKFTNESEREKITPMSTAINAKNCNSRMSKGSKDNYVWISCEYSDGKSLRKSRVGPYNILYDFSELLSHPDAYIEFNIYAGEHYNSDPLLIE